MECKRKEGDNFENMDRIHCPNNVFSVLKEAIELPGAIKLGVSIDGSGEDAKSE